MTKKSEESLRLPRKKMKYNAKLYVWSNFEHKKNTYNSNTKTIAQKFLLHTT